MMHLPNNIMGLTSSVLGLIPFTGIGYSTPLGRPSIMNERQSYASAKLPGHSIYDDRFLKDHLVKKRKQKNGPLGSGDSITAKQYFCAERLGVDISECNSYGVFINRTHQIADNLLSQTRQDSWNDVEPVMLEPLNSLLISDKGIQSVSYNDFDGLITLLLLDITNNEIENLPENLFSNFDSLIYLSIYGNPITLSEGFFKMSQKQSPNLCIIYNTYLHLGQKTPTTVRIQLGESEITASQVAPLFSFGEILVNGTYSQYFFPAKPTLPRSGFFLNVNQRTFVCIYLIDELQRYYDAIWNGAYTVPEVNLATINASHFNRSLESGSGRFLYNSASGSGSGSGFEFCEDGPYFSDKSDEQRACFERLHVNPYHCNAYGVYTHRTPQVSKRLLDYLHKESWLNVVPEMLSNISSLHFNNHYIGTLKSFDFDGLSNLKNLKLSYALDETIPEKVFLGLDALTNLRLDFNQHLKTVYNTFPDDLPKLSNLFIGSTPLEISIEQFQKLQEKPDLRIFYADSSLQYPSSATPGIVIQDSFIPLVEIQDFFTTGSSNNNLYLKPSEINIPSHLDLNLLTINQKKFLCSPLNQSRLFFCSNTSSSSSSSMPGTTGPSPISHSPSPSMVPSESKDDPLVFTVSMLCSSFLVLSIFITVYLYCIKSSLNKNKKKALTITPPPGISLQEIQHDNSPNIMSDSNFELVCSPENMFQSPSND